jgi:hypothetical protein
MGSFLLVIDDNILETVKDAITKRDRQTARITNPPFANPKKTTDKVIASPLSRIDFGMLLNE